MGKVSTVSRVISSVADERIVLTGGQIGRTMSIGNSWTKIRIGMRCAINPNGITSDILSPEFYFGVCSGTTNMAGSPTCDNFIGLSFNTPGGNNAVYNAGPPIYYMQANRLEGVKRRGTTRTVVAGNDVTLGITGSPTTIRSLIMMEIWKGATYTFRGFSVGLAAGAQTDVPVETFLNLMACAQDTCALTNYGYGNQFTGIAMDETTGNLDTINIWWLPTLQPLEISDVAYTVMTI